MEKSMSIAFPLEEVPRQLNGVELSDRTRELLSQGRWSDLVEDLHVDGKSLKNAKLKLSRDDKGEITVNYQFQQERLVIPETIGSYTLSQDDKRRLTDGQLVGPINSQNQPLYLKVDPELNSVVVKTGRDIDAGDLIKNKFEKNGHFELAGYAFTKEEINHFCDGKVMPMKVYEKNGNFFVARVSLTKERDGLEFTDVKSISPSKAAELKEKFNTPDLPVQKSDILNSVVRSADNAITPENSVTPSGSINKNSDTDVPSKSNDAILQQQQADREFSKAFEARDFKELVKMKEKGIVPSEDFLLSIEKNPSVRADDKVALFSIYSRPKENVIEGVVAASDSAFSPSPSLDKTISKGAENDKAKNVDFAQQDPEKQASSKTTNAIGNAINRGFTDM